jgi:hypothetical protein
MTNFANFKLGSRRINNLDGMTVLYFGLNDIFELFKKIDLFSFKLLTLVFNCCVFVQFFIGYFFTLGILSVWV